MQRRHVLRIFGGGFLLRSMGRLTLAQEPDEGTPDAMPRHYGLPRPVLLGDGIELVDYRIYPSTDVPRIIGEIINTRDDMVDAPGVSVTFPDLGTDGLAYAPSFLPVMRPGESNLVFGILPHQVDSNEALASADFGLCDPVGPGEHSERLQDAELSITIVTEDYRADSLNVAGTIHNAGSNTVTGCAVNGMVRDQNGRYVGVAVESGVGNLPAGATSDFLLWSSVANSSLADPYLLLGGSTSYTVDVIPGISKPLTLPGCPAIYPWSEPST